MIRSNVREITAVWSPAIGYIQELETLTAKYRIKQYQHLAETDASTTSERVKASAYKANAEKEKMNELLKEMEHITEISKEIGNIILILKILPPRQICWHLTHPLKQQGQVKQVQDLRLLQIRLENWQQTAHSQQ